VQDQPHSLVLMRWVQWQDKVETTGDGPGCRSCRKVTNMPCNRLSGLHSGFSFRVCSHNLWLSLATTRQWNRNPGQGRLRVYSHLPKVSTQASGGKEAPYCSILDRHQARSSHCPKKCTKKSHNARKLPSSHLASCTRCKS